ncbi:MAG TPA: LPS export ABC transporter periplasmic protein LptC [Caulobacteraceae bacterium]|nr:LPS export ABC transporter periplasmic protein LptC [Caulobacteraceae bacterium]
MPRGKARVHSRLVRVLRILLPATMAAVVVALVALTAVHAVRRSTTARQDAAAPIRMVNPHFFGRDNQGRAFTLSAREAYRDEASLQTVILAYPSVTLDAGGGRPSTLSADQGVYHEDTRILLLKGRVRANDRNSARFATDEAIVNTRTGAVTGAEGLSSQTSLGNIRSNGFDVTNKGDQMIFKGGVHARLKGR